jgi:hypothetical protein
MKRNITPATVIATVALFVALGGNSLAGNRSTANGVSVIQVGGGLAVTSFAADGGGEVRSRRTVGVEAEGRRGRVRTGGRRSSPVRADRFAPGRAALSDKPYSRRVAH